MTHPLGKGQVLLNTILNKSSCLTFTTTCRRQLLSLCYREIWDWVLAILLICSDPSLCYIPLKNAVFQQAIKLLRLKLHMLFQPVTWSSFSFSSVLFRFLFVFFFLSTGKTVFFKHMWLRAQLEVILAKLPCTTQGSLTLPLFLGFSLHFGAI